MVVSGAASKLETQDLVSVIASSLMAQGSERWDLLQSFPCRTQTQNRVSSGKVPLSLSDEEEISISRLSISML